MNLVPERSVIESLCTIEEASALMVALKVNQALTAGEQAIPFALGIRSGVCELATRLVEREAERRGLKAESFQVAHLHRTIETDGIFTPIPKEDIENWSRYAGAKRGFQHGFSILRFDKEQFLVDLSFHQFLKPGGIYLGRTFIRFVDPEEQPMINCLVGLGYFPMTDQSLRQYVLLTARYMDREYSEKVQAFSVRDLGQIPPLAPNSEAYKRKLDAILDLAKR